MLQSLMLMWNYVVLSVHRLRVIYGRCTELVTMGPDHHAS
jgi:hypothetical protein